MENIIDEIVKELEIFINEHKKYIENFYIKEKNLNDKWKGFKMPLHISDTISSDILTERVELMKDFLNYTITVNKNIIKHIDTRNTNNFYIPESARNKRNQLTLIESEINTLIKQITENEKNIDCYTNINNIYARSFYINKWVNTVFIVTKDILEKSKKQHNKIITIP